MTISRGLRLFPCLLYKKNYLLQSTIRNLTFFSKLNSPQSMLACRNFMSVTDDRWTGDCCMKVSRALQRMMYNRRIKAAIRVGSQYPEQNLQLANLIEETNRQDLDISVKKITEIALHPNSRSGIHEVYGSRGVLFVLQFDTCDLSFCEHLIKEICYKYDFTFSGNSAQRLVYFDQKGILMATAESGISSEEAVEIATKAGAELVSSVVDLGNKISLEVYCNPSNLHELKRRLNNFIISEAFVGYVPKYLVPVPDSIKSKMADAISDLSEIYEIEMIYENIK